jgi:hypothetical protein
VDEVARYTTIALRIEDDTIESKQSTGILHIGNVELMLEGIEGGWSSGQIGLRRRVKISRKALTPVEQD